MSKEYLEALNRLYCEGNLEQHKKDYEFLKKALNRLESIDNANPSEALECLERIGAEKLARGELIRNDDKVEPYLNTIKQALLKAQEPKQYLKWEDLDFTIERQFIKVKLNNTEYILKYYVSVLNEEMIEILGANKSFIIGLSHTCINDKQFFNDLHLERVEE